MQIVLTLGIVLVALIAFIAEWLPVELTALAVAIVLILLGLVTPEEGISGFSNSATITVLAMFVLSAGIARTGAIHVLREGLVKWGGTRDARQILVLGAIVGPISAFINNTAVVALFLPIVEDWGKKQNISVSKLLIPLSYITILGGTMTLLGTSTNILASGLSEQLGYGAFSIFQFTPLGIVVFGVGLVYLAFVAPRLLPDRRLPHGDLASQDYGLNDYVTEAVITPRSNLIGQTLRSSQIQRTCDLDVLEIVRDNTHFPPPIADRILYAGDILLVRGSREDLLDLRQTRGLNILPDIQFKHDSLENALNRGDETLAEVLILSNARLIGSTLKDLRFRQRYNTTVLALRRGEQLIRERLGRVSLQFGDLLLVQGPKQSILGLQTTRELLVLEPKDVETLRRSKAPAALAIAAGVVLVAAFDLVPIFVAALAGILLMVISGCLKPGEVYAAVRWDVILLLAGLIPLGIAMEKSGTTQWLADGLVAVGGSLSGYWVLTFFYLMTSFLTEILSNNASVVLMLPLAAEVAQRLQLNPLAFIFAVTFAASSSFATPIGYQTNTMVYAPGGYKFLDFARVGVPLNLLMAIVTPLAISIFYGL